MASPFFEDIENIIYHCLEGAKEQMGAQLNVVQDKLEFQLSAAEDELQEKTAEIQELKEKIDSLHCRIRELENDNTRKSLQICKLSQKMGVVPSLKDLGKDLPEQLPITVKKEQAGKKSFTVPYKKAAREAKEAKELKGALTDLLGYFQETFPEAVAEAEREGSEKNPIEV